MSLFEQLTSEESEAFSFWLQLWPPGVMDLYDFVADDSGVANHFVAMTKSIKQFEIDPVDNLRVELNPATCVDKLPDWETALGLLPLASDSVVKRQGEVISHLREYGSYSPADIQSILGPLLGYADPSQLAIYECPRSTLRTLHTHTNSTGGTVALGSALTQTVTVDDDGKISKGGVRLDFVMSSPDVSKLSFSLTGPGGVALATWASGIQRGSGAMTLTLRNVQAGVVGKPLIGAWTLVISSSSASATTITSWSLFVEGVGLDSGGHDGRGSEVFYWAAYDDVTKHSPVLYPNRAAALRTIRRIQPAHTRGEIVTTLLPIPGTFTSPSFIPGLIPGQFMPKANP